MPPAVRACSGPRHEIRRDVIVGSWQYSGVAQSGGRAYLFDGRSGQLLRTYTCKIPGDTFGFDAVGLGFAGDAREDSLLVTSAWSGVHGFHSGRAFLIGNGVHKPAMRPAVQVPMSF
jgi:hypothetical protein